MPRKRKRKGSLWSYAAGDRGCTVTVYERKRDGPLYARAWDRKAADGKGGWRRVGLGHRDKEASKRYAMREAAKLKDGTAEIVAAKPKVSRVISLYLQHRTPRKRASEQDADYRRAEMWTCWLGADKDSRKITLNEWESFGDARRAGIINARGCRVVEAKRSPVRERTVEADLIWLKLVLSWGAKWRDGEGRYLLPENPVRGYELPSEKNVRRPVATQDRYEAIRAVSDRVQMEVRWGGHRRAQRSYLSELLDIVNGTGRRISAVCSLQYHDLRFDEGPYGAIRWRAETDKTGRETTVPVSAEVRAALDRVLSERPGVGAAYLFPSPGDADRPVRRERAAVWLRKAEAVAGVPRLKGGQWHPYRRKWATERKHMPDVDVAAAGGWAELSSLKQAYQLADEATMLKVVLEGGELRERRA